MIRILQSSICAFCYTISLSQEVGPPLSMTSLPVREEMKLITNDLISTPSGIALSTARGEIWLLKNPKVDSQKFQDFEWQRYASGLRNPGKLAVREDGKLVVQQSVETTLISDRDNDGTADEYLSVPPAEISQTVAPSPFKGFVWLPTPESEGPFAGQHFCGSQSGNYLSRLSIIESKSGSNYSLFVFQKNLTFPTDAIARLDDNSWLIAQSNRSDPNRTRTKFALQRAVWNITTPFAIKSIAATESGYDIEFTATVLIESAEPLWSYEIESLTDQSKIEIKTVKVRDDNLVVSLECETAKPDAIYHISCNGVWSSERDPIQNPMGLFTLKAN